MGIIMLEHVSESNYKSMPIVPCTQKVNLRTRGRMPGFLLETQFFYEIF